MFALRCGPALPHAPAHQLGEDVQERLSHVAGKGEIPFGVAGEMVVEKDAAGPARLAAVRQIEVAVAPGLELRIVLRIVAVAGRLVGGVEIGRVRHRLRRVEPHRRQVAAAAEPALGGHQHARVEMRRRHARALHMRDQADAARPEPRVFRRARDLGSEFRAEFAPDGGDVHAHLFEHPAAHHAHDAATAGAAVFGRAGPGGLGEAAGGPVGQGAVLLVLDRLERGADPVAQALEPGACGRLEGLMRHTGRGFDWNICHRGLFQAHSQASPCGQQFRGGGCGCRVRLSSLDYAQSRSGTNPGIPC